MTLAPDEIPRAAVLARLRGLEAEHDVRVVYAVESGSRAWGFASRDSDVDARFLYVRRPETYVSVFKTRDVIERPVDGVLDVSGWDVQKALGLLYKSNPVLLEWLRSPPVYLEAGGVQHLRALVPRVYSRRACFHHYASMARSNYRAGLRGEAVRPKRYVYVLRPLLCCRWIEAEPAAPPPVAFDRLVERFLPDGPVRHAVDGLLEQKRAGLEGDARPPIPTVQTFVEDELARLEALAGTMPPARADPAVLDAAFRRILDSAWPANG